MNGDLIPPFAREVGARSSRIATRSRCGGGRSANSRRAGRRRSSTSTRCGSPRSTSTTRSLRRARAGRQDGAAGVMPEWRGAGQRARAARGRLPVPVRTRLPLHRGPQEPARADQGVQARVPAGQRREAGGEVDQRREPPARARPRGVGAGDHPDITLIDAYVSAAEKNAMIDACDCYVSLHRSEGFGLTVAEAMLLGKPVIATRYGGRWSS